MTQLDEQLNTYLIDELNKITEIPLLSEIKKYVTRFGKSPNKRDFVELRDDFVQSNIMMRGGSSDNFLNKYLKIVSSKL